MAKKAWEEIRGTPEGLKPAADGRPTQRPYRVKYEMLQGELLALTDPAARGYAVHGVREGGVISDTEVRLRGEAERLGPAVPRGFLTLLDVPGAAKVNPSQSGRLELAQWLTSPKNPLAARVIVNRVWQHLFGQGIVTTVDNFGINGDRPSHPELLDYLANEFIEKGWSVKKLVRTLALTRAYQLGADAPVTHQERDPANRLVWRHSPRRLDAEELRDTMLATSGRLTARPADPAVKQLKMIEMRDNGVEAKLVQDASASGLHRSVYLPLLRGVTPSSLAAFDPVEQTLVTGERAATTVPTQALYLLNSTFVRSQSLALAERLLAEKKLSPGDRIRRAYLLTLGRQPHETEIIRAEQYLTEFESEYKAAPHLAEATSRASVAEAVFTTDAKPPVNPDDVDRTAAVVNEETVDPADASTAAWMTFAQALYASAEFRFVR